VVFRVAQVVLYLQLSATWAALNTTPDPSFRNTKQLAIRPYVNLPVRDGRRRAKRRIIGQLVGMQQLELAAGFNHPGGTVGAESNDLAADFDQRSGAFSIESVLPNGAAGRSIVAGHQAFAIHDVKKRIDHERRTDNAVATRVIPCEVRARDVAVAVHAN